MVVLSGLLRKKTHGGAASLYAAEKAFGGRKKFKVLNWNALAKFSALVLGIRIAASALLSSFPRPAPRPTGSSVKTP